MYMPRSEHSADYVFLHYSSMHDQLCQCHPEVLHILVTSASTSISSANPVTTDLYQQLTHCDMLS